MDSDLEAKNSTIVFRNWKKSYTARQWRDRRRLAGREAESLTRPMKEFGFYPSSKMKPWTSFKWRNHMMRFACSEHLRSPQSDHQFHLPHNHTLLEGPAKAVCPEQLSLCLLRPKRLFHLFLVYLNKMFPSTGIHFSIHSCNHTPTHFHSCRVSLCACYLPPSIQGSSCLGTPVIVEHGILYRKQKIMEKV